MSLDQGITDEFWQGLEEPAPAYGTFNAHRVAGTVVLAIDHVMHRHILLPLTSADDGYNDSRSRGITIRTHDLEIEGETERPFLDITCTDRNGYAAFTLVARDLTRELASGTSIADATRTTIARWRRFWSSIPAEGLTPEQIRGLFGELWFILVWLLPHSATTLGSWVGPSGSRHDFQWPANAIECKATTSTRGHIHHVNGIDQLQPPDDGSLRLFSLRIREEPSATNSLPTLVETIRSHVSADAETADVFDTLLTATGYSDADEPRYRETRFRVTDERLYNVDHRFPRLTIDSFLEGIPAGIERIEYEINLDAAPGVSWIGNADEFVPPT